MMTDYGKAIGLFAQLGLLLLVVALVVGAAVVLVVGAVKRRKSPPAESDTEPPAEGQHPFPLWRRSPPARPRDPPEA